MIKTILVMANETPMLEATLSTAVELGRRFGAHLDVLHVGADPAGFIPPAGDMMTAPMAADLRRTAEDALAERAARVKAAYEKICGQDDVSSSWHVATGWEPDIAAAAGRLRDLTLVGPPAGPEDMLARRTLHALLFDSGRPVLLLPAPVPLVFGRQVALAWNGSAQSARAVAAALPFFGLAERTVVLSAGTIDPHASSTELIAGLARHGIEAVSRVFEPSYVPVGQALLEQSHQVEASLLAMGAYGHSRLREMVLGGATREVLSLADLPVLMAH